MGLFPGFGVNKCVEFFKPTQWAYEIEFVAILIPEHEYPNRSK